MKKTILIVALVVLALGALGIGVAFAQGPTPPNGGRGPMMQNGGYGWMHDYVEQALAAKLDLSETQVEEALAAGKPMYQIALDNGIKQEDLATFMNGVHKDAFDKAVKDGVMTQEQADFMLQRMQNMYQNGYGTGTGTCPMGGGSFGPQAGRGGMGMGRGFGWQNQQPNP
jgi:hypothetical protein